MLLIVPIAPCWCSSPTREYSAAFVGNIRFPYIQYQCASSEPSITIGADLFLNCHPERLLHSHRTTLMEWVLQNVWKHVNVSAKDLTQFKQLMINKQHS